MHPAIGPALLTFLSSLAMALYVLARRHKEPLHWMLLGVSLFVLGLQCVYMGILSQVFFDYSGKVTQKWFQRFRYTRAVAVSAVLFLAGLVFTTLLTVKYWQNQFKLPDDTNNFGFTGLLLMIAGFMTFTFTLILHSTVVAVRRQ